MTDCQVLDEALNPAATAYGQALERVLRERHRGGLLHFKFPLPRQRDTVDSNKLECGCKMFCAGVPLFFCFGVYGRSCYNFFAAYCTIPEGPSTYAGYTIANTWLGT